MARNVAVVIVDADGAERAVHRIPYGARLKVDEGDQVKRGQRIAEWDPYTRPIITEKSTASWASRTWSTACRCRETVDEATGIAKRVVIDWRINPRSADLQAGDRASRRKDGKIAKLARGGEARYLLPVDAIIAVEPGATVQGRRRARAYPDGERQDPRHHRRSAARGGTVRGAPSEGPRDHRRDRRHGRVRHATTRTSAASRSCRRRTAPEPVEYLIPKGKHIHVQEGDIVEKGDYIVDGNPAPHDILAIKGVEELAAYLVNEIQEVYRLQGVNDQRQAHRGDRSPDAAEGRDHRCRRHRRSWPASRSTASSSTR